MDNYRATTVLSQCWSQFTFSCSEFGRATSRANLLCNAIENIKRSANRFLSELSIRKTNTDLWLWIRWRNITFKCTFSVNKTAASNRISAYKIPIKVIIGPWIRSKTSRSDSKVQKVLQKVNFDSSKLPVSRQVSKKAQFSRFSQDNIRKITTLTGTFFCKARVYVILVVIDKLISE